MCDIIYIVKLFVQDQKYFTHFIKIKSSIEFTFPKSDKIDTQNLKSFK